MSSFIGEDVLINTLSISTYTAKTFNEHIYAHSTKIYNSNKQHTGQCKRTGGCYNELVVAFYSTGGGLKGKKIYTC